MKIMSPESGFLGLPKTHDITYKSADAIIIPFGLEASVSYGSGTKCGPKAMINASHNLELFDEQFWCEPSEKIRIATLEEQNISDNLENALHQLSTLTEQVLKDNKFPFIFGGEHSITAGAIRPFAQKYPELAILHFDAHADLRDGYENEHYSHASALRRCLDFANIKLVSVGIRSISAEEIPFLEENKDNIHIYWAKDKQSWDVEEILSHLKGRTTYLTFDLDAFDASLMPATGTPEPGGLFWDEAINIIEQATKVTDIVGADINELAPIEDMHSCDFLAAKLAYKILSHVLLSKKLHA